MSGLGLFVQVLQVMSGIAWLAPLVLFSPAVIRIWRAPMRGPSRPDPLDVLVSPLAFIAALQFGFVIRWVIFPDAIAAMGPDELVVWAGLYTLSGVGAALSLVAYRVARGF